MTVTAPSTTGTAAMRIGVFFGSTSYGTKEAAELIRDEFGLQAPEATVDLVDVAKRRAEDLAPYHLLVLGTSTWGLGGLQHDWDAFIWELLGADLSGIPVAVFALGDQVVWSDTFVDSLATVFDAAAARGAAMVGSWSTDGYAFDHSKSVRAGRFLGLVLDRMNQRELTPERVRRWVAQVLAEHRVVRAGKSGAGACEPTKNAAEPAAGMADPAAEGSARLVCKASSPMVIETAPAKVNLSLLVGPRGADGYHELFTVFVPLHLYDTLEFQLVARPTDRDEAVGPPQRAGHEGTPASDAAEIDVCRVVVTCPGVPSEWNLATRALRLVEQETGWTLSGSLDVRKRIPTGAGLGGGSSDAAAALRAGARLVAEAGGPRLGQSALHVLARRLGADVPFFIDAHPGMARGVGDVLHALPLPSLALVLYLPQEELSTARVYAEFDRLARPDAAGAFQAHLGVQTDRWQTLSQRWRAGRLSDEEVAESIGRELLANDLEPASRSILPGLSGRAERLREQGALGVLMSGSGPTIFGLWRTEGEAAEAVLRLSAAGHVAMQVRTAS